MKRRVTLPTVGVSCPKAMVKMVTKITKPKPSLNSDSPSIWVEIRFGALSFLTIARTAIGSVGEMSAPNNKQ
ncbi:Uncharacterised protein [Vibrio cholerae]|uniref:Uncharacterized protein n=1 Tax=Vibrio cholerae TaxID=666 RepID=A0A655ZMR5_VIBCL|nr:Uncharacterised protein [Vibrio cholerae]CSD57019.1 Uncharacterised protein [Vibrio cholerae]